MRSKITSFVESKKFQGTVLAVIVINAITLGLETAPDLMGSFMPVLHILDTLFLTFFTLEIALKLWVYRSAFFRDGWNNFDFIIVFISLLPFLQGLSVLRSLRILRVLRLISGVPQFKKITQAFFDSLSGLAAIGAILSLLFYIGAVITTKLFGEQFPQWFGTIGESLFSLFQIMTLESWSMGIVRPVMEVYPYAWLFFVLFILLTTFATLNLLIGVIVDSMQTLHDETADELGTHLSKQDTERAQIREKVAEIETVLRALKQKL